MILVYILSLLIMVYLAYAASNDIVNVTFLLLVGYLVSAICCLYNYKLWAVSLHISTVFVVLLGIGSFLIGAGVGKRIKIKRFYSEQEMPTFALYLSEKKIHIWFLMLVDLFCIGITLLLYRDVVRIANLNFVSWGNTIYNYRQNLNSEGASANLSSVVNIGLRFVAPFAYMFFAILISNIITKKRESFIKKAMYIMPSICYIVQTTLRGLRIPVLGFLIACVFIYLFSIQNEFKRHIKIKPQLVIKSLTAIFVLCVIFYYAKFIIGKQQSDSGVFSYVTNYLGGSLQLFDMYLQDPPTGNPHCETFSALINSLQKFGLFKNVDAVVAHEYRSASTGVYIGNIYTGFRLYLHDYGILGVVGLSALLGGIYALWYKKIISYTIWNSRRVFSMLLYASFLYKIVFHFFTDYFYSLIGVGWCVDIIIFYLVVKMILDVKV